MPWKIDPRFDLPVNSDVLRYVRETNPSAHSDVSEELYRAIDGLPGAALFCPDNARYAWVAAHTNDNRIFALAHGMKAYALRVGSDAMDEAVVNGGMPMPEIGADWIAFDPFLVEVKTADMRALLKHWTLRARDYVTTL